MNKIAAFIVKRKVFILTAFFALAIAGAILMSFVSINADMTKYLPDDSAAKEGIAVMKNEFGDASVIDVMFTGLSDEEADTIQSELLNVDYVSSVIYDKDSDSYHKDGKQLFVVNLSVDTYSQEAADTLHEIQSLYADYDIAVSGEIVDNQYMGIGTEVLIIAIGLLLVILFAMSRSWLEPVLFLVAIGIAILLNAGTNILLGSVSSMTNSIAAILQLVLSMDYSIMLIDRYHQERQKTADKELAMQHALSGGFLAIAGSSVTTIVGLLCLIFMSFTIGMDLGIVLAKGAFFCLVSILFVLPGLILLCDKGIEKTQKRTLRFNMKKIASFSYKGRYAILVVFVLLFAAGFIMKDLTLIDYSLTSNNPDNAAVEETFPSENTLLLLYENTDEDKAEELIRLLEEKDGVSSVSGYANTIGKTYTAEKLADEMDMDSSLLNMLYYNYYKNGETGKISLQEFFTFLQTDVASNEQFEEYFTDDTQQQLNQLSVFTSKEELSRFRTSAEMASLLGMDAEQMEQLYLYYFSQQPNVSAGSMTVNTFVSFLKNDVASNPQCASYLTAEVKSQLEMLSTLTNPAVIQREYRSAELASLFDMEPSLTEQVFYLYHQENSDTSSWTMTLPTFLNFLLDNVAGDAQYASYFDESTVSQLRSTKALLDTAVAETPLSSAQLGAMTGTDPAMIDQLFAYASMTSGTPVTSMNISDFLSFILNDIASDPLFSSYFDPATLTQLKTLQGMVTASVSGKGFSSAELASYIGMDAEVTDQVYYLYYNSQGGTQSWTMSPVNFINFIVSDVVGSAEYASYFDQNTLSQLQQLQSVMNASLSDTSYSAADMAELLGMDGTMIHSLYLYYQSVSGNTSGWTMTLPNFVDFILEDVAQSSEYGSLVDRSLLSQLTTMQSIMDGVQSDSKYTASELLHLLDGAGAEQLDENTVELMYLYYFSLQNGDSSLTMSLYEFLNYLVEDVMTDARFASYFDAETKTAMTDAQKELADGKDAMVGSTYSRLIINTTYGEESEEVYALIEEIQTWMTDNGCGQHYFVGNSAVAYEMQKTFSNELNFITLLTVISVFLVVLVTFRSLSVPLILVLLIQCAVYLTTASAWLQGTGVYYLAMIIVQAILMGATIDYGILYTEYYKRLRQTESIKDAMLHAYNGSIGTILTSSSILFFVTLIVGLVAIDPTTAQVCQTISKGSFFAAVLVIFVLPALEVIFDRWVCGKKRKVKEH